MSAKFHFSADVDRTRNLQSITSGTLRERIYLDRHPRNLEFSHRLKPSNEFGAKSVSSLKRTKDLQQLSSDNFGYEREIPFQRGCRSYQ
jgi:hypothetical protein